LSIGTRLTEDGLVKILKSLKGELCRGNTYPFPEKGRTEKIPDQFLISLLLFGLERVEKLPKFLRVHIMETIESLFNHETTLIFDTDHIGVYGTSNNTNADLPPGRPLE
jgi:hypothetical protein